MLFILIVQFICATILKKVREYPYNDIFYLYDTLIYTKSTEDFLHVTNYIEDSQLYLNLSETARIFQNSQAHYLLFSVRFPVLQGIC